MGAAALLIGDPDRAPAFEQDAGGERCRDYGEVGALHRGLEIGIRRGPAPAVLHRHVHQAEALLRGAVDVLGDGVTRLPPGLDEGAVERIAERAMAGGEGAAIAAIGIAAAGTVFGPAEIRQHMAIAPARRALALPPVEILRIAANINEAVDGRGTADHLAARTMQRASAKAGFGFGVI